MPMYYWNPMKEVYMDRNWMEHREIKRTVILGDREGDMCSLFIFFIVILLLIFFFTINTNHKYTHFEF